VEAVTLVAFDKEIFAVLRTTIGSGNP
jgi:hypothetical protein